jgi:hypothetical protein
MISVVEAIMRRVSNAALKGDLRAQDELLVQYRAGRNIVVNRIEPDFDLDLLSDEEMVEFSRLIDKADTRIKAS